MAIINRINIGDIVYGMDYDYRIESRHHDGALCTCLVNYTDEDGNEIHDEDGDALLYFTELAGCYKYCDGRNHRVTWDDNRDLSELLHEIDWDLFDSYEDIWEAIVDYMNEDIRDCVSVEYAPCSHELFYSQYVLLDPEFPERITRIH